MAAIASLSCARRGAKVDGEVIVMASKMRVTDIVDG